MSHWKSPGALSRAWLVTLSVGGIALLGLNLWLEWVGADPSRSSSGPTAVIEAERDGMRVRSWCDRSHATTKDQVTVWLVVENWSQGDFGGLRFLSFETPGFTAVRACWRQGPVCVAGDVTATGFPTDLRRGSTATFHGAVEAKDAGAGRYLTGLLSALGADGHETVHVISVGPVTVSAPPTLATVLPKGIYGFFKDLGLTLMLGLFAFLFQGYQQRSAQLHETWSVVFPRAHESAVKYLLPIVGAATGFVKHTSDARELPLADEKRLARRRALFYVVDLFGAMHRLASEAGGYVLSDSRGEEFLFQCWRSVRIRVENALGFERIQRVLLDLGKPTTFLEFEGRFSRPALGWEDPRFTDLRNHFEGWIAGDVKRDLQVLDLYRAALEYEANAVYGSWYPPGQIARQSKGVAAQVNELLKELEASSEETSLQRELREYAKRLRG